MDIAKDETSQHKSHTSFDHVPGVFLVLCVLYLIHSTATMFRAFQVTGSNIARSRILSTTPRHTCLASRAFYVDSGESPAHDKLRAIFLEYKKAK